MVKVKNGVLIMIDYGNEIDKYKIISLSNLRNI